MFICVSHQKEEILTKILGKEIKNAKFNHRCILLLGMRLIEYKRI